MTEESVVYNLGSIRELLLTAFTADDLRRFCQVRPSLRPVVHHFGPNDSPQEMADELINYCETRSMWPEFLAEVKEARPKQYARFGSRLTSTLTTVLPVDE
jgi:hypothetical protein